LAWIVGGLTRQAKEMPVIPMTSGIQLKPGGQPRSRMPGRQPPVPDALLASRTINPDPPTPMLTIKERLRSAWSAYKRLTKLSFPRRFPIVQFPNLPLIVAFLAGAAGRFLDGSAHSYSASVSYLAMTIWAYEELAHGVNWFRRLLGLTYVILLIVRVAHALHA
jgi:hypothetical protein